MSKIRAFFSLLEAVAVTAVLATIAPIYAQGEKTIAPEKLSNAVTASFHKAYPNATVRGASVERENGKTYYEIESTDSTVKRDLLYTADGTCVEIEETIDATTLPRAVSGSLHKEFPEAKILRAESITKGQALQYEVVVQSGERKWEVVFDPNGIIVEKQKQKAKADEGKEKDED